MEGENETIVADPGRIASPGSGSLCSPRSDDGTVLGSLRHHGTPQSGGWFAFDPKESPTTQEKNAILHQDVRW